jgi:hypothetical protein
VFLGVGDGVGFRGDLAKGDDEQAREDRRPVAAWPAGRNWTNTAVATLAAAMFAMLLLTSAVTRNRWGSSRSFASAVLPGTFEATSESIRWSGTEKTASSLDEKKPLMAVRMTIARRPKTVRTPTIPA